MPPALPHDSDSDSENASDELQKPTAQDEKMEDVAQGTEPAVEGAKEEEDDDEDGDDDEDTYIVEKIVEHRSDFEDGVMRYLVKWKGYEKKSERTWEPEENLEGARDILEEYWKTIGGKPVPGQDEKSIKKRSRQNSSVPKSEKEVPTKKQRTSKGGRKSNGNLEQDVELNPMFGVTDVEENSSWKPPPAKDGSWDPLVQSVDTVVKENSDGKLWGYLIWHERSEEGRLYRTKAKLDVIYRACPQRMLKFYEKHLVFSTQDDGPAAGS